MSGMSLANGIKVAAAVASTALGASTFGQGAPEDGRADALRAGGASSLVDGPGVGAPVKAVTHEMVEVDIGGRKVNISRQPLALIQKADQDLIGGVPGGSDVRANSGIVQHAQSLDFFNNGKLASWDVQMNRPMVIGSMSLRDDIHRGETQMQAIVAALKAEGYTGAAVAMTHGSAAGALLLQTKDNGVMALPFDIPSFARDVRGTDKVDSVAYTRLMPAVIAAQLQQAFGLEVGVAAPAPVAAPAAQPPALEKAAPTTLSAEQLQAAAEGRYEDQFGPALRGDRLSRGTLPVKSVQDKERILLNEYRADVRAVSRSANNDLRQLDRSISARVVSDEARIVAVRMGMSPEDAANMTIVQLPALRTDVEQLRETSRRLEQEYSRKISGLR
jgi:hypothetical protein